MKKKFTSVLLAVVLLFSNTLPAFASENQTTSEAGSKEATVLYDMSADYTITLPKKITLNSTKQSEYSVKVEGDIPSSERVYVSPVDAVDKEDGFNFYMQNQNENSTDEDVLATVTQSKVYWNFQDVSDGVEVTDNTVTAEDLKAGKWKGTFTFEINLKSVTSIDVTAKDSDGNDLNASAEAIIGEEKDNLLEKLGESGLVDSAKDVDALIDVKSDNFDNLADATFDVSNIAQPGDKVVILHYDETKGEWEYIGEDTVGDDGTVSGDFSSFSPVAFVKVTDEGEYEHVHVDTDGDAVCWCGEMIAGLYDANGVMLCSWEDSGIDVETNYTSSNYQTLTTSPYYVINKTYSFKAKKAILPKGIEHIGNYTFKNSSIKTVILQEGVVSIGDSAFSSCSSLSSITIPEGVTSIGEYAFEYCRPNLKSVSLPNSVTSIGARAFDTCTYLSSINIPESVVSIGNGAFSGCGKLSSVTLPEGLISIDSYAFEGCGISGVSIPSSTSSIGTGVFANCTTLQSISVDENNTIYDSRNSCNAIVETETNTIISGCKNSTVDSSVSSIGERAFYCCSGLKSLPMGNITSIGKEAFYKSGLTSITIPASVSDIPILAFGKCYDLASISVDDGNTVYDSRDNCNAIINSNNNILELGCKNSLIPSTVTEIEDCAFEDCKDLTSITIPGSVTRIGTFAFARCTSLSSIIIPSSVKLIYSGAFEKSGLSSVTFEDTTTWYVGSYIGDTSGTVLSDSNLSDTSTAAEYLTSSYVSYYWSKE